MIVLPSTSVGPASDDGVSTGDQSRQLEQDLTSTKSSPSESGEDLDQMAGDHAKGEGYSA
jgi:hypothetical protein